jgi:hypothetical protein
MLSTSLGKCAVKVLLVRYGLDQLADGRHDVSDAETLGDSGGL